MTENEYLDPKRFPLSSQEGLNLADQQLIDAINLDDLKQMQERGEPLDEERQRILAELLEKAQFKPNGPLA